MKKTLIIAALGSFLLANSALFAADAKDTAKTDAKEQKSDDSCCSKCGDKKEKKDGNKKHETKTEEKK